MVPSKFNIIIPSEAGDFKYTLYNTFSDSQAQIGSDVLALLEPGHKIAAKKREKLLVKYAGSLKELGFLVENRKNEDKAVKDWFYQKQINQEELQITVLPTYRCNLACVYCFQSHIDTSEKNKNISKKTILRLVKWAGERMDSIHPRKLQLLFYGGEPLCRERDVLAISTLVSNEAKKRSIGLSIQMITNGTLLQAGFINSMVPLGLECVKITIDGTKDKHNQLRIGKKSKRTFDIIIGNLLKTKDKLKFIIGSNYNLENFNSIPKLYDHLIGIGLRKSISRVNFRPIFQGGTRYNCDVCSFSESDPSTQLWLYEEARKRGLETMDLLSLGPCGFHKRDAYTIDPEGKVYKCEGLIGMEGAELGDLYTGDIEEKSESFIARFDLFGNCGECGYLPICGGGCRYWAYVKTGDFFGTACEKKYFDFVSKEIIPGRAMA
ncbi:MAG: SPASM domain-containing protein [Proteobacteria bacterium]|nr:SPASM domain-containing protein [Pseudomonadota bacterium]